MKTLKKINILLLSLSLILLVFSNLKVNAQPGVNVSFQQFYDELSPYGEWVDDPEYGYIWIPNVEPDFQPYATNGRWVMTDYGNTWVSNYNWGWAPFHYGRWNFNQRFGWSWVPGYEWGPAWVHWRSGGGYYGWAPLAPGLSIGVNINIPANHWVFVPQRYILNARVHRYYVPRRTVVNVYNRTTIINNTYVRNNRTYVTGPRINDLQRATRSRVQVHQIANASRPGAGRVSGRSLEIYRPNVTRSSAAKPSRITSASNIRSTATNNRNNTNVRSSSTNLTNNNRAIASARTTNTGNRSTATSRQNERSNTNVSPSTRATRTTSPRTTTTPRNSRQENNNTNTTRSTTTKREAPAARSSTTRQGNQPSRTERSTSSTPSVRSSTPRNEKVAPSRTTNSSQRSERESSRPVRSSRNQ